jgi:protein-tyrosine-phosphatase
MNAEPTRERRAAVHAALGEPARLAIADMLALTDASPSEIGRALDMPSNLLAHHLGVLQDAGVIVRGRSEADRRRTYVRLSPDVVDFAAALWPQDVPRVVFVCTQNSARSQLAAALWASRAGLPVASAGTRPASHVHPRAVALARRHGLELRRAKPAHVSDVVRPDDLVVAVCDHAYEELAGDSSVLLHWSIPDPARSTAEDAFDVAFDTLSDRVGRLAGVLTSPNQQPRGNDG